MDDRLALRSFVRRRLGPLTKALLVTRRSTRLLSLLPQAQGRCDRHTVGIHGDSIDDSRLVTRPDWRLRVARCLCVLGNLNRTLCSGADVDAVAVDDGITMGLFSCTRHGVNYPW